MRFFTYGELAFYPSLKAKGLLNFNTIKDHTRISGGFGLCIPVNQMISILVYYNAFNFGTSKNGGDFERRSYFNVNMGFF